MTEELVKRNYDADPVKKWKKAQDQQMEDSQDQSQEDQSQDQSQDSAVDGQDDEEKGDVKNSDYDYLLGMTMWTLTHEKKEELLRKKQEKHKELEKLRATSKEDLYREDLKEFVKKLDDRTETIGRSETTDQKGR
jgi:DNA topoisomerase-2